nr:MAG TPA_asm: hypothetical protein [Caudoviricetes sp.]
MRQGPATAGLFISALPLQFLPIPPQRHGAVVVEHQVDTVRLSQNLHHRIPRFRRVTIQPVNRHLPQFLRLR